MLKHLTEYNETLYNMNIIKAKSTTHLPPAKRWGYDITLDVVNRNQTPS